MPYRRYDYLDVPVKHPVGDFARYWFDHRIGTSTPSIKDLDVSKLLRVVPWMMVLRAEEGGRLRYELCGDGCSRTFGFSYEGKLFGEGLPADAVETRRREFEIAWADGKPLFSKTELPIPDRADIVVYRGVFPFLTASGENEGIAVVLAPVEQRISALS